MPRVSICIPSYKRSDLLRVALESCVSQTFKDFEIVISDDSPDTRAEEMVRDISGRQPIRYFRNVPGLGQARNVNQLFNLATGEFLLLLHDDNFLTPTALEGLITPLEQHPAVVASFGKHYLAMNDGSILMPESELMNRQYFKSGETASGVQRSAWSSLVGQFPGDGYMVRTEAARRTLLSDDPEVGEACDAEFAYRLAEAGDFFFVGKYILAYRMTEESITSDSLRITLSKHYFLLGGRQVPRDLEGLRRAKLQALAPAAVNGCLLTAERRKALRVLLSPNYPWKREFAKGVVQFGLAFAPRAATEMIIKRNSRRKGEASGAWAYSARRIGED